MKFQDIRKIASKRGLKVAKLSQLPPTLSVACNSKTTDNVLRLAGNVFIYS